jgi:cytochrome P450
VVNAVPSQPGPFLEVESDALLDHPVGCLAAIRHQAPVCPTDRGWLLVVADETVREVLLDTDTFSSRVHKHVQPPADVAEEVAAIRSQGWPYTSALGTSDAPDHTRNRKLVNKSFTPRALQGMEPAVHEAAQELAAALPDGVEIDLLAAYAERLPVWAISSILGLPHERRDDVRRWSMAAVASIGAVPSSSEWVEHERDLLDYQLSMAAVVEAPPGEQPPGLIAELAANLRDSEGGSGDASSAEGPGALSMPLLLTLLRELVVAGNETTGKFIAEALRLFGSDPEQWQRIRDTPEHAETLVEEALRLATPTQSVMRVATKDTALAGVAVPAGTQLMVSLASANRDEDSYAEPDAFSAERSNGRQHLAFGKGAHMCIGAGLARMESRIALQVLAQHVDRIDISPNRPPRYLRSYVLRGPLEMWGTVTRRRS